MCEWEWVPISGTDWDRWIVASVRHLPSVGSTGMLNVAAGLVVYSLNRSIDLHMKIHLQQSFESLGTGPRSECPPSLCSQHPVKYIHRTASVLHICPGRAFSYHFRFHPLLPSLFLSFSFRFVCIFPHPPVPGLKGSNLRQHDEDPCLHSEHAHNGSYLLLPVSSLMLLIRAFRDIYAFFYPLCPMNSEDFFFSSVLPTTLKQLSHLAFTFHGSEPPISTQNHAEAHAGTRDRNTEMHKKASKEHSWITKKKSSNGNRIGLN